MKIFIFIYIFFFAFEQFLSSPITEKHIKDHGNLTVMLNLSLKSPTPKIDNVNKVTSKIGTERKDILVATAKSTEINKHAADGHKDSNVENEKKSLNNGVHSQLKDDLGNLNKNEKTESLHDKNLERHEDIKATPTSHKKHETKSNEMNLDKKFSDSKTNKKSSEKREKGNLNEISSKPNKGVGQESAVSQQISDKADLISKSIFINSTTMIMSYDRKATKNNKLENKLSGNKVSGKFDMKNSGTNSKNFKDKRNINEAIASAQKITHVTLNDSKQDSRIQNKASNLIEDTTRKYQNNFTQKQTSNFNLTSENKTTNIASGKSVTAVKISSTTSSSNNHKQQDNSPVKETEKSSDKVKSLESDRMMTENNIKHNFTSISKQIDSVAKLVQADGKKSEKKKPNILTTIKNAGNNDHKKI